MKTTMEQRLTSALAARAEQVQTDRLGPVAELPVRRRALRPLLVGLAAAAVVTAVVGGPRLLAHPDRLELSPAPGAPVPIDVDGDGTPEPVRLDYDRDDWEFRVVAGHPRDRYAPSGAVTSDVPPRIIGPADVDGDGREEVAVDVDGYFPVFFQYVPAEGIGFDSLRKVRMAVLTEEINGWSSAGRLNDWFIRDGRFVTWHPDEPAGAPVPYWEWQVVDERLVPGPARQGCRVGPDSLPAPCSGGKSS